MRAHDNENEFRTLDSGGGALKCAEGGVRVERARLSQDHRGADSAHLSTHSERPRPGRLTYLSDADKTAIYEAALEIIGSIGMRVLHPEALELLRAAGCEVTEPTSSGSRASSWRRRGARRRR